MRQDVHMPKRKRRTFTPDQKADAVNLVKQTGNLAQVARDLDLTPSALQGWVKQAEVDESGGQDGQLTTEERTELRKLRKENRILEQEREFLRMPLPSAPGTRISLRADPRGEGQLPSDPNVPSAKGLDQRLLRVG